MKFKNTLGILLLTIVFSSVVSAENKIIKNEIDTIKNEEKKNLFVKGAVFAMLASWSYAYATAAEGLMISSVATSIKNSLKDSESPWAQAFLKEFEIVVKLNVTKAITPLITVFTILYVDRVLNKSVTCEDANAAITLASSSKQKNAPVEPEVETDMSAGAGSGGCGCC